MKNLSINGTIYENVSSIMVKTEDGQFTEFKDIDEVTSMKSETLTPISMDELFNKINDIYAVNPNFKLQVTTSSSSMITGYSYSKGNSGMTTNYMPVFATDTTYHFNLVQAKTGSEYMFNSTGASTVLNNTTCQNINLIISSSALKYFASYIKTDSSSYTLCSGESTTNPGNFTFTFYY